MKTRIQTKKLVVLSVLSAISYLLTVIVDIRIGSFLSYEPKDVVIAMGGFVYGPMAAAAMSVVVSFIEMITVSKSGFYGLVMNIISSCAFACTASLIYKKSRTLKGAIIGLISGVIAMTGVMIPWNYIVTPIYMGMPRENVLKLIMPVLLPFNLIKSIANSAMIMLLYKPLMRIMRKTGMIQEETGTEESRGSKINFGLIFASVFIIATCIISVLIIFD